jgi:cyclophilin family peptidyl-prolyl cis-trans isomerase
MWDRIRGGRSQVERNTGGLNSRPAHRTRRHPLLEVLEDRHLLTSATLQPIANVTVPSQQGTTIPLLAASGATDPQTYTVTSSNPNIAASIATGPFWTLGVSYTDPTNSANSFTGNLTYQLFQNLTPNTVNEISNLTNDGYFVNTGMFFNRIVSGFVVQGGSPTLTGEEPNPPVTFANENLQQLAFTGTDQLGMANANTATNLATNSSQFFTTLAPNDSTLGYNFTLFGQLLTGVNTINQMAALTPIPNSFTGEVSQPPNPITITSASLSSTNPNGTLIIDTSQALQDATSTIVVTATDTANGTKTSQTFGVAVGPYGGPVSAPTAAPTNPPSLPENVGFRPFANSTVAAVTKNTATPIQLDGASGYPNSSTPSSLTYSIVSQPTHGTITDFNPSTGTLTYTPDPGYGGLDSISYLVTATGPQTSPPTTVSNPGTVTLGVDVADTGAVSQVGPALVISPVPNQNIHVTNKIEVSQIPQSTSASGEAIVVTLNGVVDDTVTSTSSINSIIVYGGRRVSNRITIEPSVTVPTTLDGGQSVRSRIVGGSGETREHGWFGHSTLVGGPGTNQLIGQAGKVRFKPSKASTLVFAGQPKARTPLLNATPPAGTVFKFVHGKVKAISISTFKGPPFKGHSLEE